MSNKANFEGLKERLVEDNEREHGAEARQRWGDETVDASNRKMLGLNEKEFERFQELGAQINALLEQAVGAEADPAGETGAHLRSASRMARLHLELLHARGASGPG